MWGACGPRRVVWLHTGLSLASGFTPELSVRLGGGEASRRPCEVPRRPCVSAGAGLRGAARPSHGRLVKARAVRTQEPRSPAFCPRGGLWSRHGGHVWARDALTAPPEVERSAGWLHSYFVFICCRIIKVTAYE